MNLIAISQLLRFAMLGTCAAGCTTSPYRFTPEHPRTVTVVYGEPRAGTAALVLPSNVWLTFPGSAQTMGAGCEQDRRKYSCKVQPAGLGPFSFIVQAGSRHLRGYIQGESDAEVWRAPFEREFQFEAGLAYQLRVDERRDVVRFDIEPLKLTRYAKLYPEGPIPQKAGSARPPNKS